MVFGQFAKQVRCAYCDKINSASNEPVNGDRVAFYNQTKERTEKEPGIYRIPVFCYHCNKDWFVVWDRDSR